MSQKMNYTDQSKLWKEHNLEMEKRMEKQRLQAFMEWCETSYVLFPNMYNTDQTKCGANNEN